MRKSRAEVTVVRDKVLDPYFIYWDKYGCWVVAKGDPDGRYKNLCFPGSFLRCLDIIAQEQIVSKGETYTIQEYIEAWKEVSDRILNAYKNWDIKKV